MKKLLFVLLICFSSFCYGQQFDGVSISGSLTSVVNAYKLRGYIYEKTINRNCAILKGKFLGNVVELFVNATPKTLKVYKISVFFPKEDSWNDLKFSFNRYLDILNSKYGKYDEIYTYFDEPYFEGDGYEMSAVGLNKCHFLSFWFNKNNTSIGLFISKWKQIEIDYENDVNVKLNEEETALTINNSF